MKVSEQISIMKAYENGKTIEVKRYDETKWKSIDNIENYQFNFSKYEYRIATEPKYRPYESVEEAFNEAKKHGFWVKVKINALCFLLIVLRHRETVIFTLAIVM